MDRYIIYIFFIYSIILLYLEYNHTLNYVPISIKAAVRRYNKYYQYAAYKKIALCRRFKTALVVLLEEKQINSFVKNNYVFLRKKFYDRLIFFNTEKKGYGFYKNISYELINISYLWKEYPYEFNFSIRNKIKKKRSEWGYQHMIRFYFKNIFIQKSMCNVKWYMRLDSDSIFNSSINPFKMVNDSFVYMFNNYYPSRNYDIIFLTNGMEKFLNDYIYYYNIKPMNKENWNLMFSSSKTKTYYNNLEIVNMNFFLTKKVQKFINIIDNSHNIFYKSWGDAPLRYATLSLFAKKEQITSFENNSLWYYWHDPN